MKHALCGGTSLFLVVAGIGCGGKATNHLTPQAFYNPAPTTAPVVATPAEIRPPAPRPPEEMLPALGSSAPLAADPGDPAFPASRPSAPDNSQARRLLGTYMIIGIVVAEANGHPIYADKILASPELNAALLAKVKEYNPQEFRAYASGLIRKKVDNEIFNELEFAAAQRNNTDEEQQMAEAITAIWRQREITKAGGSIEIARVIARRDENMDFDDLIMAQYRTHMILIYYEKHVWPRVQISANDMRRFFDKNQDKLFNEKAAIQFRVIQLLVKGSRNSALTAANSLAAQARQGKDFAELARSNYNDERSWSRNGGYMQLEEKELPVNPEAHEGDPDFRKTVVRKEGKWFPAGSLSLAMKPLETALFAADKGAIVGPIETDDAFYVAKLEDKTVGQVHDFEENEVQFKIRSLMTAEQRMDLRRKEQLKLMGTSVWRIDSEAVETAVEMAMQKYAIWKRDMEKGK